jgi:chaperonin GroEL (HSP60 family)
MLGMREGVVGRVRDSKEENFGLNAETSELSDMIKAAVIDPARSLASLCRTPPLSSH